jgi:hypothetical protein
MGLKWIWGGKSAENFKTISSETYDRPRTGGCGIFKILVYLLNK